MFGLKMKNLEDTDEVFILENELMKKQSVYER